MINDNFILEIANDVIDKEIAGLNKLKMQLNEAFINFSKLALDITSTGGKLVITGIGKSAHIGRKIAATLTSTGTQCVFMHPTEAMHGDLGILNNHDLLIAISYSGETDELLVTLPAIKKIGSKIVAIVGNVDSKLAKEADIIVPMKVDCEADPFNLAPTVSTTVLTALGDALAVSLIKLRGFTKEDYGHFHPAGAIGRSLILNVENILSTSNDVVVCSNSTKYFDSDHRYIIIDENTNELIKLIIDCNEIEIDKNKNCCTIGEKAITAVKMIQNFTKLVVVIDNNKKFIGYINNDNLMLKKFKI